MMIKCVFIHIRTQVNGTGKIFGSETQGIDIYCDTIDFLNLSDVIIPIFLF